MELTLNELHLVYMVDSPRHWVSRHDGRMPPSGKMVATFRVGSLNAAGTSGTVSAYSLCYGEYFNYEYYDYWCMLPEEPLTNES